MRYTLRHPVLTLFGVLAGGWALLGSALQAKDIYVLGIPPGYIVLVGLLMVFVAGGFMLAKSGVMLKEKDSAKRAAVKATAAPPTSRAALLAQEGGRPEGVLADSETVSMDRARNLFRNEQVFLPLLAKKSIKVAGRTFEKCVIVGPAVLLVHGAANRILGISKMEGGKDAFWAVSKKQRMGIGGIEIEGCTFLDCEFQKIGFAGTTEDKERWTKTFFPNS